MTPGQSARPEDDLAGVENVELTTVGIDIGSSTSHLMFARVHLQRLSQSLSSQFVVVSREILWRSSVLLTPYLPDNSINVDALGEFIANGYASAGLQRADVDSGAVILTGEALKRRNAQAVAELFAEESGRFVCASAGHHLEAALAAQGSGAVAACRSGGVRLHLDLGGGTSKIAVIADGAVLGTAAVAVGGRLVALDGRRVVRVEGPALQMAEARGIPLTLGAELSQADEQRLASAFVDVLAGVVRDGDVPPGFPPDLLLVDNRPGTVRPTAVSFSGGVAEYLYGEDPGDFGDVARSLAGALRVALGDGRLPLQLVQCAQHIRATVIGASQFSVQVSGNTVALSGDGLLPLRNLPVLHARVDLTGDPTASTVADAVKAAVRRSDENEAERPVAVALRWRGDPSYPRLRAVAEGLVSGLARHLDCGHPLIVLVDGDVARSLGGVLSRELDVRLVACLDGVKLEEFDYVDIGQMLQPSRVVPLVIKSLLFADHGQLRAGAGLLDAAPTALSSR